MGSAPDMNAFNGNGCAGTASSYINTNDTKSTPSACAAYTGTAPSSGYVTVGATKPVSWHFANNSDETLGSKTSAEWGLPGSADGMRPFAICENYPAFNTWMNGSSGPSGTSGTIQIPFTNGNLGCQNAPGNWAFLDYNGTSGGANDLKDWFANGYPDPVTFPSNIMPQTGHVSSLQSTLQTLVDAGTIFPIAVYDLVTGNGNNASYHAVGVVKVQLIAFQITGSPDNQYMTFKFVPGFVTGVCCGSGPDTGARVVNICAVNRDPKPGECGI